MKYIMFKCDLGALTQYIPVIFPAVLVHDEVAKAVRKALPIHNGGIWEVNSAGEVDAAYNVSGRSETLNIDHDKADEKRILMADYGGLFE